MTSEYLRKMYQWVLCNKELLLRFMRLLLSELRIATASRDEKGFWEGEVLNIHFEKEIVHLKLSDNESWIVYCAAQVNSMLLKFIFEIYVILLSELGVVTPGRDEKGLWKSEMLKTVFKWKERYCER